MAIKYNNKQVKVVKFDNNDVKKIIKDGTTVWVKPYTLTENSFDNSLVTYTWTKTEEPSTGVNKTVTKSVSTSHYDMKHTSTVFNNDTLKVTYPSSGSKVVDAVRVDGKLVSNNGTFTVSDDVEVITASRCTSPVSLTVKLDQGINYLRIEYMSKEGQHKYVELEDSANYTITDIWTGSIVEFKAGCKSGHMLSSNTTHTLTNLRKWNDGATVSNVTEERTWYQYVADKNASLTIVSELQPAYLTAYWPSSVASLFIKYTNDNDEEKTITLTSSMATGTTTYDGRTYYKYKISNIKYATSYYYTITPVSGTTDLFPILEDYEAMRDSYQSLWIYPNYQSATIKLNWDTLDTAVKAVSVLYKRSDRAGTFQKHFTRRNGYSTVSDARKNTLAELGHFDFTHAGCRVDETDGKTKLFLDKNENIFQDVTIEQLNLDERPTPITVVVPSNYSKIIVYYINTSGEETSQEFSSTGYITDAAEGSYFNYEGYLKNGTVVYGYYWIYKNGSGWSYTHIAPDGTTSKGNANTTSSSGGSSGGSSTVTNNTITPPNITTYTPPKVENPVYRDVEVVFNDYVKYVYVDYYTCDANGYLVNEWYRIYPTDAASRKKFKALVGYNFYWKAYGEAGCLPSPEWESFRMSEIATAYQISPVAVPTPGTIRVVVSDGVKDITVKYYDVPSDEVDTQNRTETFTSNADITDALIGTRYSWTATAKTGTLQKSSGSGRVSKHYYESMIAPELDTEPYTLYFDHMPDTYQKWEDYRHDAGPDDILRAESDGSNALRIVCRTASGTDRWDNIVTIPSDSSKFDYEGTPTVAIYDKSNTKLLDLTTNNSYTLTDSSVPNNKLYIKASGGYIAGTKTYTVKLPTKPTNATSGYMHTSSTSTVGLPEDTAFEYGTTVYYFLVYPIRYYNYYDAPSGWTKINTTTTHVTYRVDSASVNEDCPTTSPFDASGEFTAKTWKVTLSGDHVYWTSNNKTVTSLNVYTGCTLSVTGTNTITCKAPGGTTLWDAIAIRNTDTAQYSYSGIPEIEGAAFFPIEITADTTIKAIKITRSIRTYSVTLSPASLTAVSSLFLAEDSMATTGSASGTKFDYNKTVYGIAKVPTSNLATYAVPSGSSGWTYKQTVGNYAYYTVGSVTVDGSPATGETISVSALTVKGSFTITLDGTGVVWKQGTTLKTSMTAYKGDVISRKSSTSIACAYKDASNNLAERWVVTVSRAPDTNTTTYSGTPSIQTFTSRTVTSDITLSNLIKINGIISSTRKYTVKWYNGSTLLETDSVEYNTKPDYNSTSPTKPSTAQYTYTWSGQWSASSSATSGVTEANLPVVKIDVNYYAVGWTRTTRKYTVTWKNWDGTVLETDKNVAYGTTPTYNGSTPTKAADTSYTYAFKGWSPTVSAVTGNTTYTATYNSTPRSYTITFKNSNVANWTSLSETAYPGDTITKQTGSNSGHVICAYLDSNSNLAQRWKVSLWKKFDTAQYTYKMTSWDFVLPSTSVTRDMTINAPSGSVTTRKYAVRFNAPTVTGVTLFTSTNNLSLSGNASGYNYSYGSTVYLMASVSVSFPSSHTMPSNWKQMNCNGSIYTYQIGSPITVNSAYSFGTATMPTVPQLSAPTLISEESTATSDTSGHYDTCCSVTFKNPNNITVKIYYDTGTKGSGFTSGTLAAGASFTKDFYVMSGTKWYIWFKADGYPDSSYISGTASSGSSGGGDDGGRETTV